MEKLQTAPSPYAALTMPLEADDHLDQTTFHTRYEAMPSALRAELIGGYYHRSGSVPKPSVEK